MMWTLGALAVGLLVGTLVGLMGYNAKLKKLRKRLRHMERLQQVYFSRQGAQ